MGVFGNAIKNAQYREQPAPPPDVSLTINFPQGRKTHAMSIQEFKQRLIIGGVAEVQI